MTIRTLPALPALAPLYARAVLTGPGRSLGSALADLRFAVADQQVDRDRLTAYQRVCGYRVSDVLPPTYLHLVSFGLSVARMTEPDFPFPLLGLVHVNNTVTMHRPVSAGERVTVQAWAEGVRPHASGHQVDLVSEAVVDGTVVWQECSTYLRRGTPAGTSAARSTNSAPAVPSNSAAADDQVLAGSASGSVSGPVASRWAVPADIGRRYAALSGDRNPIHLYPLTARLFGFRRAIAHGMWVKARTLSVLEGRLPTAFVADVAFKTPVFLPSAVEQSTVRVEDGWDLGLRGLRNGKPHLVATVRGLAGSSPRDSGGG